MKVLSATVAVAVAVAASVAVADLNTIPDGTTTSIEEGNTFRFGAAVTYSPIGATGMNVLFGAGPTPPGVAIQRAVVLVDEGVEESPFHGDYIARSINTIQFSFTGSGYVPALGVVRMKTASRYWDYDFRSQASAVAGAARTISVPLAVTGWTCSVVVPDLNAALAADLQKITSVSIILAPTDAGLAASPEQSYTIDNCVLVNDDGLSSQPAALTPLERALLARFGFGYGSVDKLTAAMKTWDADGDGMCDYIEISSENDPAFANAIFAAADIEVAADGVNVTWTCVKGDSYTVLRSDALGGAFAPVSGLAGVVAADTGYMQKKDVSAAGQPGPFYYRIRKDQGLAD